MLILFISIYNLKLLYVARIVLHCYYKFKFNSIYYIDIYSYNLYLSVDRDIKGNFIYLNLEKLIYWM